jgi:hypothetical protein
MKEKECKHEWAWEEGTERNSKGLPVEIKVWCKKCGLKRTLGFGEVIPKPEPKKVKFDEKKKMNLYKTEEELEQAVSQIKDPVRMPLPMDYVITGFGTFLITEHRKPTKNLPGVWEVHISHSRPQQDFVAGAILVGSKDPLYTHFTDLHPGCDAGEWFGDIVENKWQKYIKYFNQVK